jgi:hypothetical protein
MQNINDDYDDNDYDETFYECDEIIATKYNIILCELYNDKMHGATNELVSNYYLVINRIKKLNMDFINCLTQVIKQDYIDRQQDIIPHKIIKNYQNMITNPNYIKPEIGEVLYLQSGHAVCIIKTFWLKIIQRAWKKVYKIRAQMIKKRCHIQSLKHREITGTWPQNCRHLPSLRGILLS